MLDIENGNNGGSNFDGYRESDDIADKNYDDNDYDDNCNENNFVVNVLQFHPRLYPFFHSVIRFVSISVKFSICTVVGKNGTFVEDKMRTFQGEVEY